jgi:hypothetical protein
MEVLLTIYFVFGFFALIAAIIHLSVRIETYRDDSRYKGPKAVAKSAHWVWVAIWILVGVFLWPLMAAGALLYFPFKFSKHARAFVAQVNADRRGAEA